MPTIIGHLEVDSPLVQHTWVEFWGHKPTASTARVQRCGFTLWSGNTSFTVTQYHVHSQAIPLSQSGSSTSQSGSTFEGGGLLRSNIILQRDTRRDQQDAGRWRRWSWFRSCCLGTADPFWTQGGQAVSITGVPTAGEGQESGEAGQPRALTGQLVRAYIKGTCARGRAGGRASVYDGRAFSRPSKAFAIRQPLDAALFAQ